MDKQVTAPLNTAKATPVQDKADIPPLSAVSATLLGQEQHKDESLNPLWKKVGNEVTRGEGIYSITTTFVIKRGIPQWQVKRNSGIRVQVVVPTVYHQRLLHLAHDMPMVGHLVVQWTLDRLSQAFYWPGVDGDVQRYCASCDSCQ